MDKWLADADLPTLSSAKNFRQLPEWESDYPWICGDCRRFRHKSVFVPDWEDRGFNPSLCRVSTMKLAVWHGDFLGGGAFLQLRIGRQLGQVRQDSTSERIQPARLERR